MICTDAAVLSTLVSAARHLLVAPTVACVVRFTARLHGDHLGARHFGRLTTTPTLHLCDSVARSTLTSVTFPLTMMSLFYNYRQHQLYLHNPRDYWLAVKLSGDTFVSINVVTLCRGRLVSGWVTVFRWVIYFVMQPATQVNSAWPSLRG